MRAEPLTERDTADLRLVLDVVEALRAWERATAAKARLKPLREAVWFYWQQPRLEKGSVRGKYPRSVPWSPTARQAHARGEGGLVIEHTEPMKVLLRELIDNPVADLPALADRLDLGLSCVVITHEESIELARSGVASSVVDDDDDPYARYRVAGLDPGTFAPIADERR